MTTGPGIDTIKSDPGEFDLERLEFHPKVKERLQKTLAEESAKLKSCKPDQLVTVQTWVAVLEWLLGLPKQIRDEEREKRAKENG